MYACVDSFCLFDIDDRAELCTKHAEKDKCECNFAAAVTLTICLLGYNAVWSIVHLPAAF